MNYLPALILLPTAALLTGHAALPSPPAQPPATKIQKEGTVTAWQIAADGTVALRLEDQQQSPPTAMWFVTPATQTDSTRFEELMLTPVLAFAESKLRLTIVYEQDKERSGKSIPEALPIVAVMWGTSLAEAGQAAGGK